jgi:hypothetical protein
MYREVASSVTPSSTPFLGALSISTELFESSNGYFSPPLLSSASVQLSTMLMPFVWKGWVKLHVITHSIKADISF